MSSYRLGEVVSYELPEYTVSTVQYWFDDDARGEEHEVTTITRKALELMLSELGWTDPHE